MSYGLSAEKSRYNAVRFILNTQTRQVALFTVIFILNVMSSLCFIFVMLHIIPLAWGKTAVSPVR